MKVGQTTLSCQPGGGAVGRRGEARPRRSTGGAVTRVDYGWLACIDCGIARRTATRGAIAERETRCLRCGGALSPPHEDDDPVAPVRRAWEALLTGDVD